MRFYVGNTIQECSFILHKADVSADVHRLPDQTIELKNGSVTVSDLTVSLSGISARLHFSFGGENAEKLLSHYTFCYTLTDDRGNTANSVSNESGLRSTVSEIVKENGVYSCDLTFTVTGLDASSSSLTLTPYLPELDEESRVIPDTGELLNEEAFTISLKSDTR